MNPNIHIVNNLLGDRELNLVNMVVSQLTFQDGATTATDAAKMVKRNLQVPQKEAAIKQQIDGIILQALSSNAYLEQNVLPYKVLPCIISMYETGMFYGRHVDSPIMADPQVGLIRTDFAMTLFLSDTEEYEGGALCLEVGGEIEKIKLPKGSAIIYPASVLHWVEEVRSGRRLAAVTWMQSLIGNVEHRNIISQLKMIQKQLEQMDPQSPQSLGLLQIYSNLMKMWAEL